MNNNEIDCARLETVLLQYEELLGNDNKDSPLWYWLFESAIKCNEHEMAEKIIQKMSTETGNSAMVTLAIESKEEKYLEEAIGLAYKKIDEKDDLGYHILMEVIKVMAETGEKRLNEKAFEEARKIPDDTQRKKAIYIVLVSGSMAMVQRAKALECLISEGRGGENEILKEMSHSAAMTTEVIAVASKG